MRKAPSRTISILSHVSNVLAQESHHSGSLIAIDSTRQSPRGCVEVEDLDDPISSTRGPSHLSQGVITNVVPNRQQALSGDHTIHVWSGSRLNINLSAGAVLPVTIYPIFQHLSIHRAICHDCIR